ncbi:TPA: hypothetical protein ACH3X2_014168 [Trebouxia sp. C0005]
MPGKFAQGRKLLRQIGELTADNSGKDEHALKAPATQQGGPGHQDPQFQAKPAKKTAKTTKHAKVRKQLPRTEANALAAAEQLLAEEEQVAAQAAVKKQKQKVKKQQQKAKKQLCKQHQQGPGAAAKTCTSASAMRHKQTLPNSMFLTNHVDAKAASTNNTSSSYDEQTVNRQAIAHSHYRQSGCQLQQLFQCPLTKALLVDPVIAADGHTYERSAMEQWIAAHNTSPVTGQLLTHARLVTNMAAKGAVAIQAMCEMNVGCQPQPGCVPEALSIPAHV